MFRGLAGVVAGLLMLGSGAAQAQDAPSLLISHFRHLCDDGQGDIERASRLAQDAGWATLPPEIYDPGEGRLSVTAVYMNAESGDLMSILAVGSVVDDFSGVMMNSPLCMVMVGDTSGAPVREVDSAVAAWLGISPMSDPYGEIEGRVYAFVWRDGVRVGVPSEAAGLQAMLNGTLYLIGTGGQADMQMLLYMKLQSD